MKILSNSYNRYKTKCFFAIVFLPVFLNAQQSYNLDELIFGEPGSEGEYELTADMREVITGGLNQQVRIFLQEDSILKGRIDHFVRMIMTENISFKIQVPQKYLSGRNLVTKKIGRWNKGEFKI